MRGRSGSKWILGWLGLGLGVAPMGCGAILGLDDFSESGATSTSTGSTGTGGEPATSASSSASGEATASSSSGTGGSVPTVPWSRAVAGTIVPRGIATDSKGNIYVTGSFSDSIQFEPQAPLVPAGSDDIFLVKLDPGGSALWAQRFGKSGLDEANAIAVDKSDDVVITGSLGSAVDLGGGPLSAGAFVAKYDNEGKHLWSTGVKSSGASDTSAGYGVAADAKGNVLVVGEFSGKIDIGSGVLTAQGTSDLLVAKLGKGDGAVLWSKNFGGNSYDRGVGVVADTSSNVAMIGRSGAAGYALGGEIIDFGNFPATFVGKLDTDGNPLWGGPVLSGEGGSTADALALDSFGKSYVVGKFSGHNVYHYSEITSKGGSDDAYITKIDSATTEWIKGYGDTSNFQEATAIAIDKSNRAIFSGTFRGTLDFEGGPLTSAMGGMLLFLTKLDKTGTYIAGKSFAVPDLTSVKSMCLSSTGEALLIGTFYGKLNLGSGQLSVPGGGAFIAKVPVP